MKRVIEATTATIEPGIRLSTPDTQYMPKVIWKSRLRPSQSVMKE